MKKKWQLIFLLFISIFIVQFFVLHSQESNSDALPDRGFDEPLMDDGSSPAKGSHWEKRKKMVEKALENIRKKIDDKNSDINTKLFGCVKDALKNLYHPDIEGWDDLPEKTKHLKITLATKSCPDNTSTKTVLMAVTSKVGYHPNVNTDTYTGVMHGEIKIYPESFDRQNLSCLEGNLFHEVLHQSCFTNASENLGEKIAYACSNKIYRCASVKNPDDTNDNDYSKPDECTEENCRKEKKDRTDIAEVKSSSINDTPDDNYSVADEVIKKNMVESDFLIYRSGNYFEMDNLCGGIYFNDSDSPEKLLNVSKTLLIPSGGLLGLENDSALKVMLREYVASGGTLLVLTQQYDSHIESLVPIPEGETLKFYGWRQDQSCYHSSVYFKGMHPVVSSSSGELLSGAVDGYFETWPSTSTVLLNRTKNREAALLYYPYGNGTVILTSLYTDWGYAHSQATLAELRVVRDLITFAKNPNLPIPMYDLNENFNPSISLNVTVKNSAETSISKTILKAYTPDRNRELFTIEQAVGLDPGEEVEIPIQFTLPGIAGTEYGICHVDYELYDSENNLVQIPTESDSGRFSVYNMIRPYTPTGGMDMWLTVSDEEVPHYEIPEFTLHIKNYTDTDQTVEFDYECNHRGSHPLFTLTVPAKGKIDQPVIITNEEPFQRLWLYSNTGKIISKGVNTIWGNTGSAITLNNTGALEPGAPLNFDIISNYISISPEPGNYPIRVTLEKYGHAADNYTEVAVVYETTHDFSVNTTFSYNGTYTPAETLPSGLYRLKLEVKDANGFPETNRFQDFTYQQSGFSVNIEPVQTVDSCSICIYPGQTYTIPIKITNASTDNQYNVKNGTLVLILESRGGEEVYRKEITGITVNSGEEKELAETFTFTPVVLGSYYLKYRYFDETMEELPDFINAQRLWYGANVSVGADKTAYNYLDIANVGIKINGVGSYHINFTCTEAGIGEVRDIQVPEGSTGTTTVFEVPIGLKSLYYARAEVRDSTGFTHIKGATLIANQLVFESRGNFNETFARAGSSLDFDLYISGIAGMINPLTGELSVSCSQLNYENIQTVTLQPGVENPFNYTINIADTTAAGYYRFDVSLTIAGVEYLRKQHTISLPDASPRFTAPESPVNAGGRLTFTCENTGGKDGGFTIDILLKDSMDHIVAQQSQNHTITAGSANTLYLNIPDTLRTGPYQLIATATRDFTNERTESIFPVAITGVNAQLNSYTLKDLYFDNETITGKSEITNGQRAMENGTLNAKIIKLEKSAGVESLNPNVTCLTVDTRGRLWAGTENGIAHYDGTTLNMITQLPDSSPIGWVTSISAAPNGKVYARSWDVEDFIVIDGQNPSFIYTLSKRYPWDSCDSVCTDTQSRLWAVYSGEWEELSYYNNIYETWNNVAWGTFKEIISDKSGGIWASRLYGILHVDLFHNTEEITPDNSNMPGGEIQSIYAKSQDSLWAVIDGTLYSYNGISWTDYSGRNGYPTNGTLAVTGDDDGNIYILGMTASSGDTIYLFDNNKFILKGINFSSYDVNGKRPLAVSGNYAYTYGYYSSTDGENGTADAFGLLKIALDGGGEQVEWSGSFPVDVSADTSITIDLDTDKTLEPGVYLLDTTLVSTLDQLLAQSSKTFTVRDSDVAVSLSAPSAFTGFVKASGDLPLTVDTLNNTTNTLTGLSLTVTKISPTGAVETLLSETLDLDAGSSLQHNLTFNETTTGTWRISALLTEGEGNPLSSHEMSIRVSEPAVAITTTAPTYAGDTPFDIYTRLANKGEMIANIHFQWTTPVDHEIKADESVTLEPGESRLFSFADTLSDDRTYEFTMSGDVSESRTVQVLYGYRETVTVHALPSYREGTVTIGYDISNSGGLAFTDTLQFQLYTVGSSAPLYTGSRSHNLYPGAQPVSDTLQFPLTPGNYALTLTTGKNPTPQHFPFIVLPNGIGVVSYTNRLYPTGPDDIAYNLTNTDTAAGLIPLTVSITNSMGQILVTDTRNYYLTPGETAADIIRCDFPLKGTYTLTFTGSKLPAPFSTEIRVLDGIDITASLSAGAPEGPAIPITLDITNNGFDSFSGTLVIDVSGIRTQQPVTVSPASSLNEIFPYQTAALTPGTKEVKAFLYDAAGAVIAQTTATVDIGSADIKLTETPDNLEIDAGGYAEVSLKLENLGHLRGTAVLKVSVFDSLYQEREVSLEGGQEITIDGLFIDVPADLPSGSYPFNYTMSGTGVENGMETGNFPFKVNGLSLNVDASLDRSLYSEGETARLTLEISSTSAADASLEAMVNWGNFSEQRIFTLSSGSTTLTFDIPLDEKRPDKVFYGIYHEGGKGIYLNDIYLYFSDVIDVETDRQVYATGDIIHAVFTGDESGTLNVEAFGESYTLTLSSSVSANFQVPADTPGGTYGISWDFTPTDTTKESVSGSHPLDVSGLVVKVAKAELEKGKYAPGETVNAVYTFESNRDETLELRCWTTAPSGSWEYLGESNSSLSASRQVNAVSSYPFNTTEAGTHELVYGLYRVSDEEEQLIVSGRLAFDVGDAVLLGLTTDRFEYEEGNETVDVTADYFGEGNAQLELYLDEEKVDDRGLTINGTGRISIPLSAGIISGGPHSLKAVLTKDGLTSTKTTSFLYGTNLPNLTAHVNNLQTEGLNYTFIFEVMNSGKSTAPASSASVTDNGSAVETVSIPSLEPGASHEVTVNWSGSGRAGEHEFLFTVDSAKAVKEYSEADNETTFTLDVPVLFYTLETEPLIWPANTDISIITRLMDNSGTASSLTLDLSIVNDSSNESIFQRTRVEELPAFGSKTISDSFNTGVFPAGSYTVRQTVSGTNTDRVEEISVIIETTKGMDVTLGIQPPSVTAGTDTEVELTMNFTNTGNVALEAEPVKIDVFNKDTEETVKSEEVFVTVLLGGSVTETKILTLNLEEGNYEVRLMFSDVVIAVGDLIARGGIEREKGLSIGPRVVVMTDGLQKHAAETVFLSGLLQSLGAGFEPGNGIEDSFLKLHKGYSNISFVLGVPMGGIERDELRERVWSGEGLVIVQAGTLNNPEWRDFLGVAIKTLPSKEREAGFRLLPSDLCESAEIQLQAAAKCAMVVEKEDVTVIGETLSKKNPVVIYRKYGKGHILVFSMPLEFRTGVDDISQLLMTAFSLFNTDVYSGSDLTRLLPLSLSLTNKTQGDKSVTVKELLPYGVEGFDHVPEPLEGEELKWDLDLSAGGTSGIFYWLKLPDDIGVFDITSEIYEGDIKRDEVSLTFEVSQEVISRIDEMITEIGTLEATGDDLKNLLKAKDHLLLLRSRTGETLTEVLLNVEDAVRASEYLGRVTGLDVSSLHLKSADIIRIMTRRHYEKVILSN